MSIADVWRRLGLPEVPEGKAFPSPFRKDRHPSAQLGGPKNIFHDHASGESLDTIALVRKVRSCGFSEAVQFIIGNGSGEPLAALPAPARTAARPASGNGSGGHVAKFWSDLPTALREFEKLDPTYRDPDCLTMLWDSYRLSCFEVPADWRVIVHKGHKGIVYRGISPDGMPCSYKYRGLERGKDGKRLAFFLAGNGGALVFPASDSDAPVVVCGGEEKGAAANLAGFHALSPLTGEKELSPEWTAFLREHPREVILASDNDSAGRDANEKTAQALEKAGCDPGRIHVVAWPSDAPQGYDLNNVLLAAGVEGLRAFLESAPAIESRFPRALSLENFLAVPRPPLAYHIDGLLPALGKMTWSAPAKKWKTTALLELGICLSAGDCEWLALRFGEPQRVLFLQPELSDPLMAARLKWILASVPAGIDLARARRNLIIAETVQRRPNLATPEGRAAAERMIEIHRPGVVICDPLYMLFCGLPENDAEEMGKALDYLAGWTIRYGVAVILSHHFNKSGTSARGSSVFQGWGETDLALSPYEHDKTIMRVDGLFRCCFGKGFPAYWQCPSQDDAWFSSMPEDWQPETGGRPKKAGVIHVVTALRAAPGPGLSPTALNRAVQDLVGCGERTARTIISDARTAGKITLSNGVYSCA